MKPPKFAADVMLGRLSRWLRLLGLDTFYSNRADDDFLQRLSMEEGRILLTRDTELQRRLGEGRSYLVAAGEPKAQLAEVARVFHLDRYAASPRAPRCVLCNGMLRDREREEVRDRVPPYVYATQEGFSECRDCGHVYWQGTHVPRMDLFFGNLWRQLQAERQPDPGSADRDR